MPSTLSAPHRQPALPHSMIATLPLTDDILDALEGMADTYAQGKASNVHITSDLLCTYMLPVVRELISRRTQNKELPR